VSITREALGRDARSGSAPLRIASVPSGHVYVRHLSPEGGGGGVERLRDPDPDDPRRSAEQRWWPPVMLRPEWAETADIDVFHVQFGFDTCTPNGLRELVGVLRRRGIPLVITVHDLRNPHHADRREHDAQLDVLVPAADAVLTLTTGAAAEIARRWGVDALVVPHPHVVDLAHARALRERPATGPWTVGLHVKSLRASMDPLAVLPTLVEQVRSMPDARLLVNGHRDVLDDGGSRRDDELASYLRSAERRGDLELHVHDYLSDDDLWDYLARLDVSVLPYRFGTHSGWLEACRDLGTTVVVPDCGYFADQGPVLSYAMGEDRFDAESLRTALRTARTDPPPAADLDARARQRDEVAVAHLEVYRRLLA
jgi:glycosyltransferase involved in cell wall biosynthesis